MGAGLQEEGSLKIGVVFPQTEYGCEPAAIRDYAQTAEDLGYSHVVAYDHVLGANPERPGGWQGPYTYQSSFLEPLILFTYMAAHTEKLGFLTGVIILPQRQTALVAKQAATLDVLSRGRLRLGVGIGWNAVEYTALDEDFHTRGRRIEEQVEVMRLLWTQPLVTFTGRWHKILDAGLNPLPVQRPIPVWFGGHADAVLDRVARLGDGWLPNFRNPADVRAPLEKIYKALEHYGRSRSDFDIEARINYGDGDPDRLHTLLEGWNEMGCNRVAINTMGSGFSKPEEHLAAIRAFAKSVGL